MNNENPMTLRSDAGLVCTLYICNFYMCYSKRL